MGFHVVIVCMIAIAIVMGSLSLLEEAVSHLRRMRRARTHGASRAARMHNEVRLRG